MKYQNSDKVLIKSNITEDTFVHSDFYFDQGMYEWRGKEMTIKSRGLTFYDMIEDNGEWAWTDEMIECKAN